MVEMIEPIDLLDGNPMKLFRSWLNEARSHPDIVTADIFNFATANKEGKPSARTLYLRGMRDDGLLIYTDYESQKGKDLEENPFCCSTFCWAYRDRDIFMAKQVRIFGKALKLPRDTCQEYFETEPLSSQIRASFHQSAPVATTEDIMSIVHDLKAQADEKGKLTMPDHWGGYLVEPLEMEFYLGKRDSVNCRVLFRRVEEAPNSGSVTHAGSPGWEYQYLLP